jgi:hypothetical protein
MHYATKSKGGTGLISADLEFMGNRNEVFKEKITFLMIRFKQHFHYEMNATLTTQTFKYILQTALSL